MGQELWDVHQNKVILFKTATMIPPFKLPGDFGQKAAEGTDHSLAV